MKTRARPKRGAASAVFHTKEEYVADFLREGILSGEIPRGMRLKQADLAAELGLSITPVREALKLLAAEGYVLGATHRGAIVAPFEVSTASEVIELRSLLETRLTVTAMRRMTLSDMEQVQRLAQDFDRAHEAGDRNAARAANYRFHRFLYGLANQPLSFHFVQVLWAKYPFDIINQIGGRVGRATEEHARILDAIVSRNEEALAAATRHHIRAGWDELRAAIDADPSLGDSVAAPVAA
ncbi:MAG: GntR family transcriptional regulator [Betaproteobacteria bacterium]|nr:MAG: GntR family transcriptional regulator [Betaproteobacteria bacterium]